MKICDVGDDFDDDINSETLEGATHNFEPLSCTFGKPKSADNKNWLNW